MVYLLFILSIIAAVTNNVVLHLLSYKKIKYDAFLFNVAVSFIWIIILLFLNSSGSLGFKTVAYGITYGAVMAGFLFFKMQAMVSGPIMLTSLLGCSSFVLTTVFNAVYWKESVDGFGVLGIILMLFALYFSTVKSGKDNSGDKKPQKRWYIYSAFFLLFAASTGVIFKFHQTFDKQNTDKMMMVSAVVSAVIFLIAYLISKLLSLKKSGKEQPLATPFVLREGQENEVKISAKSKCSLLCFIAVICGVVSCVYNRLNVYLAGALPSVIFFPIFNGSVIMLASVAGVFAFKEKLTARQTLGIVLGVISILTISKFFGIFN